MNLGKFSLALVASVLISAAPASAATFKVFTDRAAFEAAANEIFVEDFKNEFSNFAGNTSGNVVGDRTTVDVVGNSRQGPRIGLEREIFEGNERGRFAGNIDRSDKVTRVGVDIRFNTGPIFGFGVIGLQGVDSSLPELTHRVNLTEIGILFGDERWLVSDIFGLTDSQNTNTPLPNFPARPDFFGILSDTAFDSFTFVHGGLIANVAPSLISEAFRIDDLALAVAPDSALAPVPLPAGLPLLLAGLGALGIARRRR